MLLMGPAEGFTVGGIPKVAFGPEKGGVPPAPVAVTPLPAAFQESPFGVALNPSHVLSARHVPQSLSTTLRIGVERPETCLPWWVH